MSRNALVKKEDEREVGTAYLLIIPSLFGFAGLHRFYTGRWVSGALWLVTGGLCGIGTVVDLFLLPRMVEDYNEGREVW